MEARKTSNLKVAGSSPAMDFLIHIIDYRKLDPKHTRIHPLLDPLFIPQLFSFSRCWLRRERRRREEDLLRETLFFLEPLRFLPPYLIARRV